MTTMMKCACPGCRKVLDAKSEHAGRAVRCPGCQKVFKLPAAKAAVQVPERVHGLRARWRVAIADLCRNLWHLQHPKSLRFDVFIRRVAPPMMSAVRHACGVVPYSPARPERYWKTDTV